ncbi:FK506-binding protein 3 isoform X2 [Rosa chinensis]|uniref:FK506-binding protein 3 isoform X2 n=1 Tax=Rosa chinensis TaxID=74649 RepID=UPI000D08E055|nr:FK506-binding protein 3 isoform X2 [Rosa chinensis]
MAGGGSRKDESVVLNSTNVFAALGSLKKKKKSDKSKSGKSGQAEPEKEVYWAPAPLTVKSWADVDDEDDDDYFATTAPPELGWAGGDSKDHKESELEPEHVEVGDLVSDSEEEGLDDVDDDVDEDHDNELEAPVETETGKKLAEASTAPKDTERQLSKKELKKKGLEELDAVLAELGLGKNETSGHIESGDGAQEKKLENLNGDIDKKETSGESKSAKKKKKKDKSSKESRESQDQPDGVGNAAAEETTETEKVEDTSTGDVKERLKKVASMKKKKSSKEMDAAARAAASEAAARNARLASAKKKEKNHYNQQPVR